MAMLIANYDKGYIKFTNKKTQADFIKLANELYPIISSEFLNRHGDTRALKLFFSDDKEVKKKLVDKITKYICDTFAAFLILAKDSSSIDLDTFEKLKNCKKIQVGLATPILTMAYDAYSRVTFTQYHVWCEVIKYLSFEIWKIYDIEIKIDSNVSYV